MVTPFTTIGFWPPLGSRFTLSSSRLSSSTSMFDLAKLGFMAFSQGFCQVEVSMLLVDLAMMGVLLMLRWGVGDGFSTAK